MNQPQPAPDAADILQAAARLWATRLPPCRTYQEYRCDVPVDELRGIGTLGESFGTA